MWAWSIGVLLYCICLNVFRVKQFLMCIKYKFSGFVISISSSIPIIVASYFIASHYIAALCRRLRREPLAASSSLLHTRESWLTNNGQELPESGPTASSARETEPGPGAEQSIVVRRVFVPSHAACPSSIQQLLTTINLIKARHLQPPSSKLNR